MVSDFCPDESVSGFTKKEENCIIIFKRCTNPALQCPQLKVNKKMNLSFGFNYAQGRVSDKL